MNVLQTLLSFSERAAKIARVIRQEPRLFALLIEEKGDLERNQRFTKDFKTLADVLVQESLCYYVALKFPNLSSHVKGEEDNSFTNTLGEKIRVKVCSSQGETSGLLAKVLDGNLEAADLLASLVHGPSDEVAIVANNVDGKYPSLDLDNIGIWIDPIDSTASYISGFHGTVEQSGIFSSGLQCVTVLLGMYDRQSGRPIGGVINQPFADKDVDIRWTSKIIWGLDTDGGKIHCDTLKNCPSKHLSPGLDSSKPYIVISSSESSVLEEALCTHFELVKATGAGYKSLTVALGQAEAYFCSKGSTFRWDTCGPHGILLSMGGGVITYKDFVSLGMNKKLIPAHLNDAQVLYHESSNQVSDAGQDWCNRDGIVAYRDPTILLKMFNCIRKCL